MSVVVIREKAVRVESRKDNGSGDVDLEKKHKGSSHSEGI
jgi:hypothetical protein